MCRAFFVFIRMKFNRKLAGYVNQTYEIRSIYKAITGREPGNGKVFCPMHDNHNTPAAKIYGNNLKCFGVCNCIYTPYDLLRRFFPEDLQRIETSIVLPETEEQKQNFSYIPRESLDLTKPLVVLIKEVIEYEKDRY